MYFLCFQKEAPVLHSSVENVVVGAFERGQHQGRCPHPADAISVDAQHLAAIRHAITEHLDVPGVDSASMAIDGLQ